MTREGDMVQIDAKDFEMNCAVLWGEFTGRDVVLTELEKKLEVSVGDASSSKRSALLIRER
jgi:hypothetical protein